MNKFIIEPDTLGSAAGCAFWLVALSVAMALFLGVLAAMGRGA